MSDRRTTGPVLIDKGEVQAAKTPAVITPFQKVHQRYVRTDCGSRYAKKLNESCLPIPAELGRISWPSSGLIASSHESAPHRNRVHARRAGLTDGPKSSVRPPACPVLGRRRQDRRRGARVGRRIQNRGHTRVRGNVSPYWERSMRLRSAYLRSKKIRKKSYKRSFSESGGADALGPGGRKCGTTCTRRSQLRTLTPGARRCRAPPANQPARAGSRDPARPGGGRPVAAVERALTELPAKRAEVCKLRLVAN